MKQINKTEKRSKTKNLILKGGHVKKIITFLQIASKYIFPKMLLLLLLMSGVEALLFFGEFRSSTTLSPISLQNIYTSTHLSIVFALSLLLLILLMTLQGITGSGSQFGYTLMRLSLKEEKLMLIWSGYYFLCLLCIVLTQVALNFGFTYFYVNHMDSTYVNAQTMFVNTYQIPLMHSLLPLSEPIQLVMLLLLLLALSFTTAYFSYCQRHGRKCFLHSMLSVCAAVLVPNSVTSFGMTLFLLILAAASVFYVLDVFLRRALSYET